MFLELNSFKMIILNHNLLCSCYVQWIILCLLQEICLKMADVYYHRKLLAKSWASWHSLIENKWRERVEKACQIRAQEVCQKLEQKYENQLLEVSLRHVDRVSADFRMLIFFFRCKKAWKRPKCRLRQCKKRRCNMKRTCARHSCEDCRPWIKKRTQFSIRLDHHRLLWLLFCRV